MVEPPYIVNLSLQLILYCVRPWFEKKKKKKKKRVIQRILNNHHNLFFICGKMFFKYFVDRIYNYLQRCNKRFNFLSREFSRIIYSDNIFDLNLQSPNNVIES